MEIDRHQESCNMSLENIDNNYKQVFLMDRNLNNNIPYNQNEQTNQNSKNALSNLNNMLKKSKFSNHDDKREINIKHGYAPEQWYWKKLQQWNIDLDKIDLFNLS